MKRKIAVQVVVDSSINDKSPTLDNDCKSWNQIIQSHTFKPTLKVILTALVLMVTIKCYLSNR